MRLVPTDGRSAQALIFAPQGRDAFVAQSLLREAGIPSEICGTIAEFQAALGHEVSFAVVTEEGLLSADLRVAALWVAAQPSWSDLPFIILTQRGGGPERNPGAARLSDILGNVTFLERPFHPTTFVSVARSALKGRQRQYEARTRIEELHEGEERLRTALLAGHLGTWEIDLETSTFICSDICKAHFGRAAHETFTHEDLLATTFPEDRRRVEQALREAGQSGGRDFARDFAIEYRTLWPDTCVHWVEMRARHVRGGAGRRNRLVGVSSDITARKANETMLKQVNETLEQRVAMRTAELEQAHQAVLAEIGHREKAEEQLRQSQKMEMIGQLTGGIAHDFNNLLMAILGNLDLLRKHATQDSKAQRLIDGALQGAERGAALTQRLLAFARRQDLKLEPVDMAALLGGLMDLLERSVGPSVVIKTQVAPGLPPALADANQLEMALLNLAINAKDAMPSGGELTVTLDLARVDDDGEGVAVGSYLRLIVTDTGHGMDRETLTRAIDPFFTTKGRGKGTGLGLSMIHGLAVQLGGALRLTSEPGQGTRAELWLPATEAAREEPDRQASPVSAPVAMPRAVILMVDDDPLVAMSTTDMLEDLGHEVIETHSGAMAMAVLRDADRIDLMITDFSMPGMTGLQLARAARQLRPDLPILLATGYAELPSGEAIDLPRLGKPYQQSQLAAEIAKLLTPAAVTT